MQGSNKYLLMGCSIEQTLETLSQLNEAIIRLKRGEVIAYPTETFFGLGADPYNLEAIEKLLVLKERFLSEGVSLIASNIEAVNTLPIKTANEEKRIELQNKFWPGPLTLVVGLEKVSFAKELLAKDGSIAIRVSSSDIACSLAKGIGGLITATSANPHGLPPARTADQAKKYFPNMFVVEGFGNETKPSTIISLLDEPLKIIREGMISAIELKSYL